MKLQKNQNLDDSDLILKKHENLELKISDNNLERYSFIDINLTFIQKIKKIDNYPPCVQIEPTSICNYRCIMCYQADKIFFFK